MFISSCSVTAKHNKRIYIIHCIKTSYGIVDGEGPKVAGEEEGHNKNTLSATRLKPVENRATNPKPR